MNWKKFFVDLFKPTTAKIAITFLLGAISIAISYYAIFAIMGLAEHSTVDFLIILVKTLLPFLEIFHFKGLSLLTAQILYFYLLSCVITKIYKNFKNINT